MSYPIIGITRIRNEALIIQDTLDHLSQFVDAIIVYDDASTDNTIDICKKHPNVIQVIQNKTWRKDRLKEETRHRQILLKDAQKHDPKWIFYVDADERFEGDIREFLLSPRSKNISGIRINLFDAYLTKQESQPYKKGKLLDFRSAYGPEKREILMIFKNTSEVEYRGLDAREPFTKGKIITQFYCQHYGKALSKQHWEDTCDYYINNFPKYAVKWQARKGQAIHTKSDFGRKLYNWDQVKQHAITIYQYNPHKQTLKGLIKKVTDMFVSGS